VSLYLELDGDTVKAVVDLDGGKVTFSARRVTQRDSGQHASISIDQGTNGLAWGWVNYERPSDRVTLGNSAYKNLPEPLKENYTSQQLKNDLDAFCKALWGVYNGRFEAVMVEGDPDTQVEWFCPPMVMQDASTILFGHRGGGKSLTGLAAAVSTQHGISNIWGPIEIANVLYINIERSKSSMARRVARINVALGLSAREPLLMLNARGKSLSHIYEAARRDITKHEVQVVFFDSISRAGAGDLNDNQPANQVMDMLSDLSPTWLAVGHMTASDGGKAKVFGSQMYENAVDLAVKLTGDSSQEDTLGVSLEITKANDTALRQLVYIKYSFNGTGLVGIEPSSLRDFPDLDQQSLSKRETVKVYLRNHPESQATPTEIAKDLSLKRENLYKILQGDDFVKLPKHGKEQPYGIAEPRAFG